MPERFKLGVGESPPKETYTKVREYFGHEVFITTDENLFRTPDDHAVGISTGPSDPGSIFIRAAVFEFLKGQPDGQEIYDLLYEIGLNRLNHKKQKGEQKKVIKFLKSRGFSAK